MSLVVTNIARPDAVACEKLAVYGVATIHESQGRTGLLGSRLRPIFRGAHISGPAVTVSLAPGDNWMIHVAVEQCRAGDVLVVSPTSPCDMGYFGELLATALSARGVKGLVIDAGCRDVAELTVMGFPVWSRAVSAQGTVKETLGSVNVSIVCAGQVVHPGDVIVADDDGVVVVPRLRVAEVAEASRAREDREAKVRHRYCLGEMSLDVGQMRGALAAKGLTYVDQADLPPMIIDVHGHYTTAPGQLQSFRDSQRGLLDMGASAAGAVLAAISDDELRESIENNQLRVLRARGGDVMLLSPKASAMEHHVPDAEVADAWAEASNDLVHRISELFPDHFAAVAQLPQTPAGNQAGVISELRRTVEELGFVGCNLNPDPSGNWEGLPLTDESWYGVYEVLEELDIPAMVHVSTACNPNFDTLGAHYLNADTSVFVQLLASDLFTRFPRLRFVIPHGGGAVPYHWGRYRGLALRNRWQDPSAVLEHVYFDTCVYHQPGIDLLTKVVPAKNLLFASEMLGAVRGADPESGIEWDDTLQYVLAAGLDEAAHASVLEGNARRVYPRLDKRLAQRGR